MSIVTAKPHSKEQMKYRNMLAQKNLKLGETVIFRDTIYAKKFGHKHESRVNFKGRKNKKLVSYE